MTVPTHPLADCWPMIEGEDAEQLRADIAVNGLRERITILDGQILDGRNRHRACVAAGVLADALPPDGDNLWLSHYRRFNPEQDGDPKTFVISKNEHRRHLTLGQRAMVAAKLESYGHGGKRARADSEQDANLQLARSDVAEQLNVSPRSVASAKTVIERGAPELVRAVERGEVSVSTGETAAKTMSVGEQIRALQQRDPREFNRFVREQRAEKQAEKKVRRAEREAELGARQAALPDKRYGVILADPEWRFEPFSRETGMDRSPDNHYPTSDLETIEARPVANIAADDCVLLLWATAPMMPQALDVMAAWGFTYKSEVIWRKDKVGTGYWFRNQHEKLLLGTRGNVPAPAMGDQWPSVIDAPVGEHSQKPEQFYELIETYFPNLPKIELNARARRPGWDAWGLEAPADEDPGPKPQLDRQGGGNGALPTPISRMPLPPTSQPIEFTVGGMRTTATATFSIRRTGAKFVPSYRWEFPGFESSRSEATEAAVFFDQALVAVVDKLIADFIAIRDSGRPSCTDKHRAAARGGIAWLERQKTEWGLGAPVEESATPIKHTRASAEPILKARYDGSNAAELAADLCVPVGTLRTWLFRCGLTDRARIVARGAAMVSEFNREKHNAE